MTKKWAKTGLAATLGVSVLALGAASSDAGAETKPRYDRRIEEAAIRMLQPKLGAMRGALDLNVTDHLYPPLSRRLADGETTDWPAPERTGRQNGSILHY